MDDLWQLVEECRKEGLLNDDGGLDWKLLVAKDDMTLFEKYKNVPVSGYETFLIHLKHTNLKQQIAYSDRYQMHDLLLRIMTNPKIEDASEMLINRIENKVKSIDHIERNGRGFVPSKELQNDESLRRGSPMWRLYELYNRGMDNEANKHILFKDIINHKNPVFFELACEDDPQNINWALNNVSKTNFDAIDVLLKHGGKIITSVPYSDEDAAWLGQSHHDEIDEVATEILRLEIEKLKELRK